MIKHKVGLYTLQYHDQTQGVAVNKVLSSQGHLYLLVTDQGFLQEESVVWESLHNVEGDGNFCDSDFRLCNPQRAPSTSHPPSVQEQQRQIDQVRSPGDLPLSISTH